VFLTSTAVAMPEEKKMHSSDNDQQITPNASPKVEGEADLFISADFLYWAVGLSKDFKLFATKGGVVRLPVNGTNATSAGRGDLDGFDTKFDPGFKVALGLDLKHDGWDTQLQYTWFKTSDTKTVSSTGNTFPAFLIESLGSPVDTVDGFPLVLSFDSIKGDYDLTYNNFDWELGRRFYVSKYLTMRPHIGLKGGWVDGDINYTATGADLLDSTQNAGRAITCYSPIKKTYDQDSYWVGIRTGIGASFYFVESFSMFGHLDLSGVLGHSKLTFKENMNICNEEADPTGASTNVTVLNTQGDGFFVGEFTEWMLGFAYECSWDNDGRRVRVEAAWESQSWDFAGPARSFNGLTTKVRFDF
jgi:hypothetical protein